MNHADNGGSTLGWIAGVWLTVGITSWSEAASFAAFCFTMYLLLRHIWRDIVRPSLEAMHVIKPHKVTRQDVLEKLEGAE
jgi:hypothetical protein